MRKYLKIIILIIIILIVCLGVIFFVNHEKNTLDLEEDTMQNETEQVDLSMLNDYFGNIIDNDKAIELLNKIKDEYSMYLSNSSDNGAKNSTGLYIYFSTDTENNLKEEIYHNAVISMIDDYINTREYDKEIGYFSITTGIDEKYGQYIYVLKIETDID